MNRVTFLMCFSCLNLASRLDAIYARSQFILNEMIYISYYLINLVCVCLAKKFIGQ